MKKNKTNIILISLILIFGSIFLFWVLKEKPSMELLDFTNSETESEQKILKVGTSVTEPFVYFNQNGELVGYDIQLINQIAEYLDMDIELIEMPFANLIPALENNNVDIIIAAIHITPDRQQRVNFSNPYQETGLVMVIDSNKTHIDQIEDINGKTVGVKIGATGFDYAKDLLANGYEFSLEEYKDTKSSFLDLGIGRVDVIFNDFLNSEYLLNETFNNLSVVENQEGEILFINNVGLGIAVSKENQQLINQINNALNNIEIYQNTPFFNER